MMEAWRWNVNGRDNRFSGNRLKGAIAHLGRFPNH